MSAVDRYFLVRVSGGVRVQATITADEWDRVECVMTETPCSMLHTLPGYTAAMEADDERQIAAWKEKLQREADLEPDTKEMPL